MLQVAWLDALLQHFFIIIFVFLVLLWACCYCVPRMHFLVFIFFAIDSVNFNRSAHNKFAYTSQSKKKIAETPFSKASFVVSRVSTFSPFFLYRHEIWHSPSLYQRNHRKKYRSIFSLNQKYAIDQKTNETNGKCQKSHFALIFRTPSAELMEQNIWWIAFERSYPVWLKMIVSAR